MGEDGCIYAKKAKKWLYIDRVSNINPNFFEQFDDDANHSEWDKADTLFKQLREDGIPAVDLIALANSGCRDYGHSGWNRVIIRFALAFMDDTFFLRSDSEARECMFYEKESICNDGSNINSSAWAKQVLGDEAFAYERWIGDSDHPDYGKETK